ncbi:VOC family protein [Streptomyces sp. CA-250714]|uniref:VOC family protein n=1 Tax=Streptomyces sp. CA-250714 TaxID=3240060 RepID=UPI003D92D9C5
MLGLQPNESLEGADPYGLFRSRAVANPEGVLRISLNVAPVPGDQGARPQHVALATDDIAATARRVRDAGAEPLPVPENYYDDLGARFELSSGALATLRELDVLYDRDEDGEFWHCCTVTLGRIFFELVQCTGGSRGRFECSYSAGRQRAAERGRSPVR